MVEHKPRISFGNVEKFSDMMLYCWLMLDCPVNWGIEVNADCDLRKIVWKPRTGWLRCRPETVVSQWDLRGNFVIIFLSDNDGLLLLLAVNIC